MLLRASFLCLFVFLHCVMYAENHNPPSVVHRRTEFAFTVSAPYEIAAPLFGADKERVWAEGWNPQFVHPQPPRDEAGAVFLVDAGSSNVWINTVYDLELGHVQYVYFAAGGTIVTLIDIRIQRLTPNTTKATVVYERTAVQSEANDKVNKLADDDKTKGDDWELAIRAYLQKKSK